MPKVVDHQQRRRELGRALWTVALAGGIEAVSVRSVAERAGWSLGAVQHYFRSRSELLTFALELVHHVTREQLDAMPPEVAPLDKLLALLPLDEESRLGTQVWVAFLSRTLTDEAAAAAHSAANADLAELCRDAVRSVAGEHDAEELEVMRLLALVDGLALHAVTDPERFAPEGVRAIVERHLHALAEESERSPLGD